jgi:hypothetical protein
MQRSPKLNFDLHSFFSLRVTRRLRVTNFAVAGVLDTSDFIPDFFRTIRAPVPSQVPLRLKSGEIRRLNSFSGE